MDWARDSLLKQRQIVNGTNLRARHYSVCRGELSSPTTRCLTARALTRSTENIGGLRMCHVLLAGAALWYRLGGLAKNQHNRHNHLRHFIHPLSTRLCSDPGAAREEMKKFKKKFGLVQHRPMADKNWLPDQRF